MSCIVICETKCIQYQRFILLLKMPGTYAEMKISTRRENCINRKRAHLNKKVFVFILIYIKKEEEEEEEEEKKEGLVMLLALAPN